MTNVIEQLGARAVIRVQEMGRMLLFVLSAFAWLVRPPFRFHQIMKQLHFIGYKSTFVVVLTAGFT
ncbi:MAG: ABC transporter permease, partial [Nitrospirota bacterium]